MSRGSVSRSTFMGTCHLHCQHSEQSDQASESLIVMFIYQPTSDDSGSNAHQSSRSIKLFPVF